MSCQTADTRERLKGVNSRISVTLRAVLGTLRHAMD